MNWLQKACAKQINRPYYRVHCEPMYGNNAGGDILGQGSYWTPRWTGVQAMLLSILRNYVQYRGSLTADHFRTRVWKIENAIMDDPPKNHQWAFTFQADAGEQVLVEALSKPELLHDLTPEDPEFENLIEDFKPDVDYSKGEKFLWNGKEVYLYPNYNTKQFEIMEPTGEVWEFRNLGSIRNVDEFRNFSKQARPVDNDDSASMGTDYFIMDMGWIKEEQADVA